MPYLKINGAASTVAAYVTGSLTVATGTGGRFGSPSPESPLLLQTCESGAIRASGYLTCTGRSGDVLTVSLTSGVVNVDDVVCGGDGAELWAEIQAAIDAKQNATGPPVVMSNVSGAVTLDATAAGAYEISLDGDATITLDGGASTLMLMAVVQRNGHTLTFGGAGSDAIEWIPGSDPAADPGDPTVYNFYWYDTDGQWLGFASGGIDAGITDLTGDVTASGNGSAVATIAAKAVTYAKIADAAGAGLLGATGAGSHQLLTLGTGLSLASTTLNAAAGTVTSVGIALPTSLFVNGSAVTSTGNLTASLATQAANTVFAGPTTGSAASPTFRALVSADIAPLLTGYATTSALSAHTGNTSNPHSVTKSQVGLGSVDNTADLSKPISTLTQAALDGLDTRVGDLESAPGALICIGSWLLAESSDLAAGTAVGKATVPAGCVPAAVFVDAETNPSGGGFSFNLNANGSTDLFSSAQAHPDASTAVAKYTGFSASSLAEKDKVSLTVTSAGTGVQLVLVTLWARVS